MRDTFLGLIDVLAMKDDDAIKREFMWVKTAASAYLATSNWELIIASGAVSIFANWEFAEKIKDFMHSELYSSINEKVFETYKETRMKSIIGLREFIYSPTEFMEEVITDSLNWISEATDDIISWFSNTNFTPFSQEA